MKKFLVAIIAILYMGSSTGATVHMHFCMGRLVEVNFWHKSDGKCSKCGMKKTSSCTKKGCCKDEHKFIKADKDHKLAEATPMFQPVFALLSYNYTALPEVKITSVDEKAPLAHGPPLWHKQDIYLLNNVFRI